MKKIGIFYGSSMGNTKAVAEQLKEKLDADIFDVANSPTKELAQYDNLVLGSSTWGLGDLQNDWEGFISSLEQADLSGKTVAIFGLGDSDSYADSFVDAIGIIYNAIKDKGCTIIGSVSTESYDYDKSCAEIDGEFVGLPLDEENQSNLTLTRINDWVELISQSLQ